MIWVEEVACLSLLLLKGGSQEDPCTVSPPTGRDRPLPDSSLGFQWPRGKGLASTRWSLVQSCPEGSGQTCGGGQLQGAGGLCRRSSWVSLGHWHEDTAPESSFSSLLGTGEKRGPYLPGCPRKVTSKRLSGRAGSRARPGAGTGGGIGPCAVASAGTVQTEVSAGLSTAEQAAVPELGHLDSGGRLALAAGSRPAQACWQAGRTPDPAPAAQALCFCALTLSTLPGKSGWAAQDVLFPDPFTSLTGGATPHPFHSQNTQKVALGTTGSQAARALAWLLPKPENASIFKDQNQVRD